MGCEKSLFSDYRPIAIQRGCLSERRGGKRSQSCDARRFPPTPPFPRARSFLVTIETSSCEKARLFSQPLILRKVVHIRKIWYYILSNKFRNYS